MKRTRREFFKNLGLSSFLLWLSKGFGCKEEERLSRDYKIDVKESPVESVKKLINLMGEDGLKFYRSERENRTSSPEGLISSEDVVILKVNAQWHGRGGTNTDLLYGIIQTILDHPDGFYGEVVVCDNRQDLFTGGFDVPPNSDDPKRTLNNVINSFDERVSGYLWDRIRDKRLKDEYDEGEGYIWMWREGEKHDFLSYPVFTTRNGRRISLKNGVWDGKKFVNDRLKLINIPVLKAHILMGATASLKNYMGVLFNDVLGSAIYKRCHNEIFEGGLMGKMMKYVKMPDLNIIDAIWVCAQQPAIYPFATYVRKNIIVASTDPVMADYYATKHILYPTESITPCTNMLGENPPCQEPPPCLKNPGHCERTNPDSLDEREVKDYWSWFGLFGKNPPVNVLRKYLQASSLVLYGTSLISDKDYTLITE